MVGHRRLDLVIEGVLPMPWRITLRELYVDEHAVRVEYEIRPPVVSLEDRHSTLRLTSGKDDLGGIYGEAGGAYGLSDDGSYTRGVRSLQPIPAQGVSWIELAFFASDDPLGNPRQIIRVPLAA